MINYLLPLLIIFSINFFGQSNIIITDIDDLKNAINSALPGDTVTVKNGSYDSGTSITITNSGSEAKSIVIKAEEIGEVELKGETYFDFRQCEYIVLEGFNFTSQNVTAVKLQACNNIRITRNRFAIKETESVKWILIGGVWNDPNAFSHHNRIDHNLFENKSYPGNFITIDGSSEPTYISSQYDRIDHNHFKMNTPRAENEKESIRVGWSEISQSSGFTVVEHNLFEDCDGDPEIISVKTCDDTVRYNTFIRCAGTLSLRHGNRSSVYGNYFFGENKAGTGGIRVYGDDHLIFNNYFEGLTGTKWDAPITLTNGDADVSSSLSKHFRINRAIIVHNTLVNNTHNIEIGFTNNGNYSKEPRDVTIANNLIIANANKVVEVLSTPTNFTWKNNIFYTTQTATVGFNLDSIAYTNENPLLEKDLFFKQTINSPSIDKIEQTFDFISTDIEGQTRTLPFDIGADEYSSDSLFYNPLTEFDVGPYSELNITNVINDRQLINDDFILFQNYPNPFNPKTIIKYSVSINTNILLTVFDILGREVTQLVNEEQKKGIYKVEFDSADFSNGIYFYSLRIGDYRETKKMIILK